MGCSQNANFYTNAIIDSINAGAAKAKSTPREIYGSCCMDNTSTNYAAFAHVNRVFPWLICVGCSTHCFDLFIEDVFRIKEFDDILRKVM